MTRHSSRTLYVGNLPGDTREREVEDIFYKYGPIVDIDLKIPPRPPGYAFVEFEDYRDAEDAVHYRDGYNFDGHRLRVEFAHGGRSIDRYSGHGRGFSSSNSYSDGGRGVPKYSDYRVIVTGLPSSASWQDLKDHMRRAGDVNFSQVFRDRYGVYGIVDYTNYEDLKYAIRKLDNSKFKNAFSSSYVKVREYDSRRSSSRSCSHSPSRSSGRSSSRSSSYYSSGRSKSPLSPSRLVSSHSYSESSRRAYSRSRSISPPTSHSHRKQLSVSPRECSPARSLSHSRSHSPL